MKNNFEEILGKNKSLIEITPFNISVLHPKSREEAKNVVSNWRSIFENKEIVSNIEKVYFCYQERGQIYNSPIVDHLLNKLGDYNFKRSVLGKIEETFVNPKSINLLEKEIVLYVPKEQWKLIHKINSNSNTFKTSLKCMPERIYYQVIIPLEIITKVEFKK